MFEFLQELGRRLGEIIVKVAPRLRNNGSISYHYFLSLDTTIKVFKDCPIIGKPIDTFFVAK